jgi:hypothetical protein
MRFFLLLVGCFLLFIPKHFSQEHSLTIANIPPELLINSNSIVRNEEIIIEIKSVDKFTISTKKVVTVFNSLGDDHSFAREYYDDQRNIKDQRALIYDASGNVIRKYKEKDFEDVSAVSSNDLFSDNRYSYLRYIPVKYPYTIEYSSEVVSVNTVFVNPWFPVGDYFQSVQNSSYRINNPLNLAIRVSEKNLNDYIKSDKEGSDLFYSAQNIPGAIPEVLSPAFYEIFPMVRIALNDFSLVGVEGSAENWLEFGQWQYDNLLSEEHEISAKTLSDISRLTKDLNDEIEKARVIYEYVQNKTRYISVQLGIGGWVPMAAKDVDALGYGDCKALTNYTRALLKSQDIDSYYTVVFAGEQNRDIDSEFASMQGNHIILNIPRKDQEDIWLECTSQTIPFNYLGDFTDNRNVMLMTPEGGQIVKTKKYSIKENLVETNSEIVLKSNGDFSGVLEKRSEGVMYGNIYGLKDLTDKDQKHYYKKQFWKLKNLEIDKISFENDKRDQKFTERLEIKGTNFGIPAGNKILVPLNIYDLPVENTPRYIPRKLPLNILRGKTFIDHSKIIIPEGYKIETIPDPFLTENEFGSFQFVPGTNSNNELIITRTYILKDGTWEKGSYENFKKFMNEINSGNNQKAVISALIN